MDPEGRSSVSEVRELGVVATVSQGDCVAREGPTGEGTVGKLPLGEGRPPTDAPWRRAAPDRYPPTLRARGFSTTTQPRP